MRGVFKKIGALVLGVLLAQAAARAEPAANAPAAGENQPVYVKMSTSMGDMLIEVDRLRAPISAENFLRYVDRGFYNNTIFHRVIPAFVIQGGGYSDQEKELQPDAPIKNEWRNGLLNERGTLSMARKGGQHDSATSQFFINIVNNQPLDQPRDGAGYAVFAKVISGLDVIDKIAGVPTIQKELPMSPGPGQEPQMVPMRDVPLEKVVIKSVVRVPSDDKEVQNAASIARAEEAAAREKLEKAAKPAGQPAGDQKAAGIELAKTKGADVAKAVTSPTGLWSYDVQVGDGPQPKPTDKVRVHYTGWLTNGTQFDSSRGKRPAEFRLDEVVAGWTEGVGGMKVGGKRLLVIPPELGYGSRNRPPIPPNSVLVFEIELLGIVQPPSAADLKSAMDSGIALAATKGADPAKATTSASGLWFYDVKAGDGAQPASTDRVKVHYTGWFTDGNEFDSSHKRGGPAEFRLDEVVAGWTEGVGGMKVGGKRLLVVPPPLGYGVRGRPGIPPNSVLVFEVELMDVSKP